MYYGYGPCLKCGGNLVFSHYSAAGECIVRCKNCDPLPNNKEYISICWNCHSEIRSSFNKKSKTNGMGYVCNNCGEDLAGWKLSKKLITMEHYLQLKGANYAIL